jgi:hypothetical protein
MFRKAHVPVLAIALVACSKEDGSDDELAEAESGDSETASDTDTEGDSQTSGNTEDGTDDADGDGDSLDDEAGEEEQGDTSPGDTGGEECVYTPFPLNPLVDWEQASGSVAHWVSRGAPDSYHSVSAVFMTGANADDSQLCVEWLVADEDIDVDECNVYHTQGSGVGGESNGNFQNLAVDAATFDLGGGPVALELWPGDDLNPDYYSASLPPAPNGVPFGGTATLAVDFGDLPALDLDLDVPEDLMPIAPAHGSTTLSSEQLASWTWSNSGGSEPLELEVMISNTPNGSGWSEWVLIGCDVGDDGEFAFPVEYFDLARERLGNEIWAAATIVRRNHGTVPLAGENLYWQSGNSVRLEVEIVD